MQSLNNEPFWGSALLTLKVGCTSGHPLTETKGTLPQGEKSGLGQRCTHTDKSVFRPVGLPSPSLDTPQGCTPVEGVCTQPV